MNSRPSLAVAMAVVLRSKVERMGWLGYIPYVFGACLALGFAGAVFVPADFWSNDRWDISTAVFAGLLAFNGLLMAMGWFAFSKIYEIISGEAVGKVLTKHDLLGLHLAFIDISHLVLIASSALSVLGLVTVLTGLPPLADQGILGACLGFTLYGMVRAFSATNMMNELVWEQAQLRDVPTGPQLVTGGSGTRAG